MSVTRLITFMKFSEFTFIGLHADLTVPGEIAEESKNA